MTCRCGHSIEEHMPPNPDWDEYCCLCPCPKYRPLETPDTQTLKGVAE